MTDRSAMVLPDTESGAESEAEVTSTLFLQNDAAVEALLTRRRQLGLDRNDEVWEGVYHVAPHEHGRNGETAAALTVALAGPALAAGLRPGGSFNLGRPDDFRVPDLGLHPREERSQLYYPSAPLVVEVRSPGDETFAKFAFYAAHGVQELWVADPLARTVRMWQLGDGGEDGHQYRETGTSTLLGLTAASLEAELDWPAR